MKKITTYDLKKMAIINLCSGACLGYASDLEFDRCDGRIISLIICGEKGILGNRQRSEIVIPWCNIECFGEDVILVKLTPEECIPRCDKRKRLFF